MAGRRVVRWTVLLGVLSLRTLTGTGSEAQPAAAREPRVYLGDAVARGVVTRAIAGAVRRLDRADCRLVLEDFADGEGQRLQAVLSSLDLTPATYLLERLWFVDGSDDPPCRREAGIRAFTSPGHKVVRVCATRFARYFGPKGASVELMVIHEMLHTLGLGGESAVDRGDHPPGDPALRKQLDALGRAHRVA